MHTKIFVAEFVGTFALIFIGVAAICADHLTGGSSGLVGIALAHGLTIAVMASATGAISGGHLNPAVTFATMITGRVPFKIGILYWSAQISGAIIAMLCAKLIVAESTLVAVGYAMPSVGAGATLGNALVAEIVATFLLMFVIWGTAVNRNAPKMGGLFIGLAVTLDILAIGPISGAAMNPARHLAPALLGGGLENIWLYWVGPFVGAAIAGLLWKGVLDKE